MWAWLMNYLRSYSFFVFKFLRKCPKNSNITLKFLLMSICFKQKTLIKGLVSASSWLQGESSFRSVMILLQSAPDSSDNYFFSILLFHDLVCQIFKKLNLFIESRRKLRRFLGPWLLHLVCTCASSIAMPEKDLLVLWITNFPTWKASAISRCLVHPKLACLSGGSKPLCIMHIVVGKEIGY